MTNKTNYQEYLTHKPEVQGFFDARTNTISYVVADTVTKKCAIIDSVMDYEPHGATLFFENADSGFWKLMFTLTIFRQLHT